MVLGARDDVADVGRVDADDDVGAEGVVWHCGWLQAGVFFGEPREREREAPEERWWCSPV